MTPSDLMLYIFYGFIVVWSLAWLWAFFRASSDVLVGMINGAFTLKGLGWSTFCALLALIPLWIAALLWGRFLAVLPR